MYSPADGIAERCGNARRHPRLVCQEFSASESSATLPGGAASGFRLDSDTVIHGRCDPLDATEVTLGGLHGNVPEKKLNLFQFTAGSAAEPRLGTIPLHEFVNR